MGSLVEPNTSRLSDSEHSSVKDRETDSKEAPDKAELHSLLEKMETTVNMLREEMHNFGTELRSSQKSMKITVDVSRKEVLNLSAQLRSSVKRLETNHRSSLVEICSSLTRMENQFHGLKSDVNKLRREVSQLKGEIQAIDPMFVSLATMIQRPPGK